MPITRFELYKEPDNQITVLQFDSNQSLLANIPNQANWNIALDAVKGLLSGTPTRVNIEVQT